MYYLGIDPGLQGAIAFIGPSGLVDVKKIPVIKLDKKNTYDIQGLYRIIKEYTTQPSNFEVIVEKSHAMPGQGVTSMFTTGYGFGLILGILTALKLSYQVVHASKWKKEMLEGMPKGKEASTIIVSRMFPEFYASNPRKKDHNIADAILIAEWGRRKG